MFCEGRVGRGGGDFILTHCSVLFCLFCLCTFSFTELQNSVNASSFLKAPLNLPGCDDDDEDSDGDEVLDMAKLRSKFVTNFETLD